MAVPDLKNFSVAPVQIWGLKDTEYQRRLRAENRPHRICAMDGETILSAYNPEEVCGSCSVKIFKQQMAEKPFSLDPKTCGNCGSTFVPRSRRRRWCYVCVPTQET